jgi:hypothetical protein
LGVMVAKFLTDPLMVSCVTGFLGSVVMTRMVLCSALPP